MKELPQLKNVQHLVLHYNKNIKHRNPICLWLFFYLIFEIVTLCIPGCAGTHLTEILLPLLGLKHTHLVLGLFEPCVTMKG